MAETLVLVPGLGNTRLLYEPQIEALSGQRPILVVDNAREGSIEDIALRILADVPGRFALAGSSMGGNVALEVMRRAPERVGHLALLDTSARPDTPEAGKDRERLIALAEAGALEDLVSELWPRLVHPRRQSDRNLRTVVGRMMRDGGLEAFARHQRAIMRRRDSRDLLPGIEIPTLVLVGEADVITPPDLAREIAEMIEWASLVIVPGAGHLSTLEQPELVSHALGQWLGRS